MAPAEQARGSRAAGGGSAAQDAPPAPAEDLTRLLVAGRLREAAGFLRAAEPELLVAEVAHALQAAPAALLQAAALVKAPARLPAVVEALAQAAAAPAGPALSAADRELAAALLPRAAAACRAPLVASFVRALGVDSGRAAAWARAELLPTNAFAAVRLLTALDALGTVPAAEVLRHALAQGDLRAADLVAARASPEDRALFVRLLVASGAADKVVKKRIAALRLDPRAFPDYWRRSQTAALHFLLRAGQFEDALALVAREPALGPHACQTLVRRHGPADAATRQFVFRAGLAAQFPAVDVAGQAALGFPLAGADGASGDGAFLSLDALPGAREPLVVDSDALLDECLARLQHERVVGLDSEWKTPPAGADAGAGPGRAVCAVLQLATRDQAFVLDVPRLGPLLARLRPVLAAEDALVLVFDARGDLGALRALLRTSEDAASVLVARLLDVQALERELLRTAATTKATVEAETEVQAEGVRPPRARARAAKKPSVSLSAVAAKYLGRPLDKRMRVSDWTRRPLSPAQVHYAALDALALVRILDEMRARCSPAALNRARQRCTQRDVR